jgi:hypothetical protein
MYEIPTYPTYSMIRILRAAYTEQVISHITCLTILNTEKISQLDKNLQILNKLLVTLQTWQIQLEKKNSLTDKNLQIPTKMSILSAQTHEYARKIASSKLYHEATYWAYWQYNIYKVGFSLPAQSLSKQECKHIQSPAICATLSKLHFIQNTSRAIFLAWPSMLA